MPRPKPRKTAAERETRLYRVIAAIQNGFAYDEIARVEAISHARVRQIVVEHMKRNEDTARDHRLVQAARLGPALRLALVRVADGKLEAIHALVKITDRLDKYAVAAQAGVSREDVRPQLIARLEMAAREPRIPEIQATPVGAPPAPPSQPLEISQNREGMSYTSARHSAPG